MFPVVPSLTVAIHMPLQCQTLTTTHVPPFPPVPDSDDDRIEEKEHTPVREAREELARDDREDVEVEAVKVSVGMWGRKVRVGMCGGKVSVGMWSGKGSVGTRAGQMGASLRGRGRGARP